jgi:hypothetical protein
MRQAEEKKQEDGQAHAASEFTFKEHGETRNT